jgi:hypothetical protein
MAFKSARKNIGVLRVQPGNYDPKKVRYWLEKPQYSGMTFRGTGAIDRDATAQRGSDE